MAQLGEGRKVGADVLAVVNTLTSEQATRNLRSISDTRAKELRLLSLEPAIARIVAKDDAGNTRTYFISRATPLRSPHDGSAVPGYRSPIGRLASLPVGSDIDLKTPNGLHSLEVLERTALHPVSADGEWDSTDSIVEGFDFGPFTVTSFRELLRASIERPDEADLLDTMLAADREASVVVEGLRRNVIAKMELRDQPLLDQFQDEIFRLPIDTRLVILGPPGTGKTTTLIKRLGLKLDFEYLIDEERELISKTAAGTAEHPRSWVMFTPTDLLKQYVKEAFAREDIPASDLRIQTWAEYRRELARGKFSVLRSGSGAGTFVIKDHLASLQPSTLLQQTNWFSDFNSWQADAFWDELRTHAKTLVASSEPESSRITPLLNEILDPAIASPPTRAFVSLSGSTAVFQSLISRLKAETDKTIRTSIAQELKRNNALLDQLDTFLATIAEGVDDTDDQELDDEEETHHFRIGREAAFEAISKAIRAKARAAVAGRSLNLQSRNGKIAHWLGDRGPAPGDLHSLGIRLQVQAAARRFVNPLQRYFDTLPRRYRRFRRERQSQRRWYQTEAFGPAELNPLEVDIILLAILRGARHPGML